MKIRTIDISGFKSFLDKASIQFPEGISAIVGPNGCGKSNVIDALRWVMGEQSVKQLRGKSMEDIIFAGASGKPPLNMAEVTLTLANDNGHAPEEFRDYAEISVTRRLFRSGESAYMINRQPCRLRDIYNLFMGSGVGTRTFSIIQQGNIGAIIDAGPDERRLFIEEAAGVTRYKFRKNEALRKVKATGNNLLRINDIISEVNRQMAGLRRQAKRAERFKQYKERFKQLDTHLLLHSYDAYNRELIEAKALLQELKDADINHVTQLKRVDAAIEEIKLKRQEKDQEIASQKSSKFELQRKIDRTEADLVHLRSEIERLGTESGELQRAHADLAAKTETMGTEITAVSRQNQSRQGDIDVLRSEIQTRQIDTKDLRDQLNTLSQTVEQCKSSLMQLVADEARYKNIYQNASNSKESLKRRLARIGEDVALALKKVRGLEVEKVNAGERFEQIKERIAQFDRAITALKADLSEQGAGLSARVKQTQQLEMERSQSGSQLAALKKMAANFEWYRGGVKAVMQAARPDDSPNKEPLKGIIGLLADMVEPAPGYETAVEAVLGEALQYILVQDMGAGAEAIDYLQGNSAGRSGFIPVAAVKPLPTAGQEGIPDAARLLNHITVSPEFETIAEAMLGHVAVVATMAEAISLFNRNGRIQTIVTQGGDVVSHQGVLIGGSQEQLSGILAKKQELKTLAKRCSTLDRQIVDARQRQKKAEETVRNLEVKLQEAIADRSAAGQESVEAEKALYRTSEDLKNARRHAEITELEKEQLMGEESDLEDQMDEYNQALGRITAQVEQAQAETTEATRRIGGLSDRLEHHNQQIVDLKLQLTAHNTKLDNGRQTLERLKEFERDSHVRLEQLQQEIDTKNNKQARARELVSVKEKTLQITYKDLNHLDTDLEANLSEYRAIDANLQENDGQMEVIQTERQKILEKIRLLELNLSEKRIMRDNIAGRAQERYHQSIAHLRMQKAQEGESIEMSIPEMKKELERFQTKISKIGDVNLGAIQEFEELKERFEFLSEQRADLEKAIEDLHKVIRKINRITQQRFTETFDQVNDKLKEVFPKLFEGGSARLDLTDPGKPLETGVEYMVHPPGKKLTRMSLLSGGEKALSAIAFIFAIFLIRPASFCLLDEIDAPLDEANIVRFNNLMQVIGKKSQIIMITHNKRSMEFAETLYGVTMEQKGISKIVSVNLNEKHA